MVQVEDGVAAGSRDKLRAHIRSIENTITDAATELSKLLQVSPKRLEYRRTDCYLGQALLAVQLAKIEMRKRKKIEPKKLTPKEA